MIAVTQVLKPIPSVTVGWDIALYSIVYSLESLLDSDIIGALYGL